MRDDDTAHGLDSFLGDVPGVRWREIAGFPNRLISEDGRVWSRYSGRLQRPQKHQRGYVIYKLAAGERGKSGGKTIAKLAHVLVAEAFLGKRPTPDHDVAHNDGDRKNNDVGNLRWATPVENMADQVRHGTRIWGERHYGSKITNEQADQIRRDYAAGGKPYVGGSVTMQTLADRYGVRVPAISRIIRNKRRVDPCHGSSLRQQ